ncbi:MAG: TolB family protein [Planctomycetaceae bacterium]
MERLVGRIAVTATVLALIVVGDPAQAVVPGANGRILFARPTNLSFTQWDIVAADPNGANETVLAGPYPTSAFDDHFIANWSPDGATAIFMANQAIWQVNADGSGLRQVFAAPVGTGLDDGPTFTPDGAHIVFTRCCPTGYGYSLWMINVDGTGLKDVTKEPFVNGDGPADTTPQVSPNGKKIVFNRCFPDAPCVVATVSISGGNLHELTDDTAFASEHPGWSPDSRTIVFQMQPLNGGAANIATIRADGSSLTQLTFDADRSGSFDPCFSPDGKRILFSHFPSTGWVDLYTMRRDGSGIRQVTKTGAPELASEWAVAT